MQHLIRATAAVSNNDASVSFRIAIRTRLDRHLPINSSHGATSSSNGKAKVTDVSGNVIRRLISAYPANDSSLTSTTSSSSVTLITRRYYVAARRGSSTPTPSPQSSTSIRFKYDNGNKDLMDHPPRSTSSLFSTSYSISPIRLLSNTTVSMVDPSHERKCRLPSDFLSTLQDMHPKLSISRNTYDLDSHGHGESYHPTAPPDVVIRPTSVKEIQDILRLCCRIRRCGLDDDDYHDDIPNVEIVSVIPYGAGESVSLSYSAWIYSYRCANGNSITLANTQHIIIVYSIILHQGHRLKGICNSYYHPNRRRIVVTMREGTLFKFHRRVYPMMKMITIPNHKLPFVS